MRVWLLSLTMLAAAPAGAADFRLLAGHGGPVHDVAAEGPRALTASFDNSVGLWDLASGEPRWLDGHEAAVKAVLFAGPDRAASAGDDFAVMLWDLGTGAGERLTGHKGQINGLALSPDGRTLASASWDGRAGLWDIDAGRAIGWLEGHEGAVNDVDFSPDGGRIYTGSADGTIRVWNAETREEERVLVRHGFGVTRVVTGDGWLAYGAVDGGTRVIDPATDAVLADLTLDRRPILAMALSPDETRLAVGDGEGFVMTVSTDDWSVIGDYQAAARGPVWALAFTDDGDSLISGGIDDAAYVWPVENSLPAPIMALEERGFHVDPATMSNGERQFRRKCSICHSLDGDGRRAGPTLEGIFGRRAGSLPDYSYSDTVARLGIEWTDETIDKLFDLGPDHFIPGSKMPMQRITNPQDRRDLIEYLRDNT